MIFSWASESENQTVPVSEGSEAWFPSSSVYALSQLQEPLETAGWMWRLRAYYSLVPSCEGSSEVGFCEPIVTILAKIVYLTAGTYISCTIIEHETRVNNGRHARQYLKQPCLDVVALIIRCGYPDNKLGLSTSCRSMLSCYVCNCRSRNGSLHCQMISLRIAQVNSF